MLSLTQDTLNGLMLFNLFKHVVILTEIMRQSDRTEAAFRELLLRLRDGISTKDDYALLYTRIYELQTDDVKLTFEESTRLFPTKNAVNNCNFDKLVMLNSGLDPQYTCRVDAFHLPLKDKNKAQAIKADDFMGLEASLYLARGARVMITQNVWVNKGLVNGATGTLKHLIFKEGDGPPNLPVAIIVEMDLGYNGPSLEGKPRHVALNQLTSFNDTVTHHYERTQLPIRIAFAITIHKCQGYLIIFI